MFNFLNGLNLWFVKRSKRNLEGKMNLRYLIGHLVFLSANKNYIDSTSAQKHICSVLSFLGL